MRKDSVTVSFMSNSSGKHNNENHTTTRLMSTVLMVRIPSALSRHLTEKVKHSTTNERRLSHLSRIHLADTLSEGRETPQLQEMTSALDTTVPLQDVSNFSEESTRTCTAQLASTKRTLHTNDWRCTRDGPCRPRPNRTLSARLTYGGRVGKEQRR